MLRRLQVRSICSKSNNPPLSRRHITVTAIIAALLAAIIAVPILMAITAVAMLIALPIITAVFIIAIIAELLAVFIAAITRGGYFAAAVGTVPVTDGAGARVEACGPVGYFWRRDVSAWPASNDQTTLTLSAPLRRASRAR